jgi:polar amino acid transport system substrate-binding protein
MKAIALVLTLVFALAGCASTSEPLNTRQAPEGIVPVPAGAETVTSLKETASDTSCNPTRSFRPQGPAPAPGAFPSGSAMDRIFRNGSLTVGVDQNTYQFGYRDPLTGQLQGFDIAMAQEIARAIFGDPNKIQYKVLTSDQRIDALKKKQVDLVVQTMTINCTRWKDVNFSSVYYMAGQKVLVKSDSDYKGLQDLGDKKVCAAKGSTSIVNVVNYDVKPKPIGVQVPNWTDCLVMLQQNQVEAISTDDTILAGLAKQDPFTKVLPAAITQEPYGMAMRQDEPDLVQFVNAVLERMRSDGTWTRIYNQWLADLLGPNATPPVAEYR